MTNKRRGGREKMQDTRQLKNLFKLGHKVSLYIPTKNQNNEDLPQELINNLVDLAASKFSEVNGGATSTEALGYWKRSTGELIKEKIILVFSYTNNLENAIETAIKLAADIKEAACQDNISLEVNNELYLI